MARDKLDPAYLQETLDKIDNLAHTIYKVEATTKHLEDKVTFLEIQERLADVKIKALEDRPIPSASNLEGNLREQLHAYAAEVERLEDELAAERAKTRAKEAQATYKNYGRDMSQPNITYFPTDVLPQFNTPAWMMPSYQKPLA